MKGLKFLAACAAVGAVSVACAAASFAVDTTYQLTVSQYNATDGTINITVPTAYAELVKGDYTLLVLSDDATSITEANKSIIKQIQQGDNTILTGVKVGTITPTEKDQTFYVRVGGANATKENPTGFAAGEFVVPGTGTGSDLVDQLIGDVNTDGDVTVTDVNQTLGIMSTTYEDFSDIEWYAAAECYPDSDVTVSDVNAILSAIANDWDNAQNAFCMGHFKDLGEGEYKLVSVDYE